MRAVLFDTETSGLIANATMNLDQQPEIIDFYACLADLTTGEIEREFGSMVKPFRPLSLEREFGERKTITEITGITNEMLDGQPSFQQIANHVEDILTSGPYVIAHNLSFDREMVDNEFKRIRRTINWPNPICTNEQTVHLKGFRLSMGKLYHLLFDETFEDAHRAKPDTLALLRVSVELFKRGII